MTTYLSKSSGTVKIITISTFLVTIVVLISYILIRKDLPQIWSIILGAVILGTFFYFYANSLTSVIVTDNSIILQKKIGKIEIEFSEIDSVKMMQYSAIPMTVGSKGFFGFIGGTMDGASSFVKDRRKMVQITTTSNKKYLVSCDESENLVNSFSIKNQYCSRKETRPSRWLLDSACLV